MPKFESFSEKPKPKRTTEELRRSNAELRRQLEEIRLRTSKQKKETLPVSRSVSKPKKEQLSAKFEKNKERKNHKLSVLTSWVRSVFLGTVIGLAGSAAIQKSAEFFVETKYEDQLKDLKELQAMKEKAQKLFGDVFKYALDQESEGEIFEEIEKKPIAESLRLLKGGKPRQFLNKAQERMKDEEVVYPIVEDIVSSEGLIEKILIETLLADNMIPKGWVNDEVESITLKSQSHLIAYEGVNSRALASYSGGGIKEGKKEKGRIVFYKDSSEHVSAEGIFNALWHELGHANGPTSDNESNDFERLKLMLSLAERIKSPDRFYSHYVESIQEQDEQKRNYNRIMEYWAEICAQYFKDPTELHFSDFQLVDTVVKKADSDYNAFAASIQRGKMLKVLLASRLQKVG
ncbi:MAG: hypothetical protein HYX21_01450 [Candidatus Yanofskybacteria bacterium]|nr:hypothetical protein [Candidatus Yanofskybacteria bacterium]